MKLGNHQEVIDLYRRSLEFSEWLCSNSPKKLDFQEGLRDNYDILGLLQNNIRNFEEALTSYQRSLDISERLCRLAPLNMSFVEHLRRTCNLGGDVYLILGDKTKALGLYQRGLEMAERWAKTNLSLSNEFLCNSYLNCAIVTSGDQKAGFLRNAIASMTTLNRSPSLEYAFVALTGLHHQGKLPDCSELYISSIKPFVWNELYWFR